MRKRVAILLLSVGTGCPDYDITRLRAEDSFSQDGGNLTVDVLWVMDNSGTMSEEQATVIEAMGAFVEVLDGFGADWQVGVTTTACGDEDGGALVAPILTPLDADLEAAFYAAVNVGVEGSIDEQGLLAIQRATSEPLLSTTNVGLVRDDADLAVAIVSDEDDHSPDDVQDYYEHLTDLKGEGHVRVSAVVGPLPAGCASPYAAADPAERYHQLVLLTDGLEDSICRSDFTSTMKGLALRVMGLEDTFYLSTIPEPGSLEVKVDGVLLYERAVNGWQYDPGLNAVVFDGFAVPGPGADILVRYYEWVGHQDEEAE